MAISVPYTFINSQTSDGTQVNANFTALINALTDTSQDFSINALTVGGTLTVNSAVITLGDAASDVMTVTATTTFVTAASMGASSIATPLSLFRDSAAGGSTNAVSFKIGNSGANQGATNLTYTNAAAAGGPTFEMIFAPRNNADSSSVTVGNFKFAKSAASNIGNGRIQLHDGTALGNHFIIDASAQYATRGVHLSLGNDNVTTSGAYFIKPGDDGFCAYMGSTSVGSRMEVYGHTHSTSADKIIWYAATTAALSLSATGILTAEINDVKIATAGKGLFVKEGSNAKMGTAVLVAGTVVVSTTAVTANSRIFLTAQSLGTVTIGQGLAVSARTSGTSFTILSQSAIDTSTVAWFIVEPA